MINSLRTTVETAGVLLVRHAAVTGTAETTDVMIVGMTAEMTDAMIAEIDVMIIGLGAEESPSKNPVVTKIRLKQALNHK